MGEGGGSLVGEGGEDLAVEEEVVVGRENAVVVVGTEHEVVVAGVEVVEGVEGVAGVVGEEGVVGWGGVAVRWSQSWMESLQTL